MKESLNFTENSLEGNLENSSEVLKAQAHHEEHGRLSKYFQKNLERSKKTLHVGLFGALSLMTAAGCATNSNNERVSFDGQATLRNVAHSIANAAHELSVAEREQRAYSGNEVVREYRDNLTLGADITPGSVRPFEQGYSSSYEQGNLPGEGHNHNKGKK